VSESAARGARPRKRRPNPADEVPVEETGAPPELVVRDDFVSWLEAEYEKARHESDPRP
jgi:hypothetical protein